jgi:transaldolase
MMDEMSIKIFADGADVGSILELLEDPRITGFTTNPTLMRKSGVTEYEAFAREVLSHVTDHPISFEIVADDFDEMERQAKTLGSWGDNVYVKIPITNTRAQSSVPLIDRLTSSGLKLNVTAIMTPDQVEAVAEVLKPEVPSVVSVFAGRVADAGVDPVSVMTEAKRILRSQPQAELLWASSREVLNIIQAEEAGCDIITLTPDLLKKMAGLGRDLHDVSLDTVKMFFDDAASSGLKI